MQRSDKSAYSKRNNYSREIAYEAAFKGVPHFFYLCYTEIQRKNIYDCFAAT